MQMLNLINSILMINFLTCDIMNFLLIIMTVLSKKWKVFLSTIIFMMLNFISLVQHLKKIKIIFYLFNSHQSFNLVLMRDQLFQTFNDYLVIRDLKQSLKVLELANYHWMLILQLLPVDVINRYGLYFSDWDKFFPQTTQASKQGS